MVWQGSGKSASGSGNDLFGGGGNAGEEKTCPVCGPANKKLLEDARKQLADLSTLDPADPAGSHAQLLQKLSNATDRFRVRIAAVSSQCLLAV